MGAVRLARVDPANVCFRGGVFGTGSTDLGQLRSEARDLKELRCAYQVPIALVMMALSLSS